MDDATQWFGSRTDYNTRVSRVQHLPVYETSGLTRGHKFFVIIRLNLDSVKSLFHEPAVKRIIRRVEATLPFVRLHVRSLNSF